MKNHSNRWIYRLWSPIYDRLFNRGAFREARKQLFEGIPMPEGGKVLFVGVGTGADLGYIDQDRLEITGIDYSKNMLDVARTRWGDAPIRFMEMDAQELQFADHTFDVTVASLILSVVPDGERCLKEMIRVTRPGGTIIVFDKFVREGRALTPLQKLLRPLIAAMGTDIGRCFETMAEGHKGITATVSDKPLFKKLTAEYRRIVLERLDG